jgi:hypothetical protein
MKINLIVKLIISSVESNVKINDKYPNFRFKERNQIDFNNPIFFDEKEENDWKQWVDSIGGRKNLELRNFLVNFRLA